MKPTFLDENEIQRRALKTVRGRIAEETTAGQTIREKPDPVVRHENIPIDTRTRYELYLLQKRTRGGGRGLVRLRDGGGITILQGNMLRG